MTDSTDQPGMDGQAPPPAKTPPVVFPIPEGFKPPEGKEGQQGDGEPGKFDLVCTFEATKDGKLCLTKLGDFDMPAAGEQAPDREKAPDYKGLSKGIVDSVGGGDDGMM